jgi:hypothetical protein
MSSTRRNQLVLIKKSNDSREFSNLPNPTLIYFN